MAVGTRPHSDVPRAEPAQTRAHWCKAVLRASRSRAAQALARPPPRPCTTSNLPWRAPEVKLREPLETAEGLCKGSAAGSVDAVRPTASKTISTQLKCTQASHTVPRTERCRSQFLAAHPYAAPQPVPRCTVAMWNYGMHSRRGGLFKGAGKQRAGQYVLDRQDFKVGQPHQGLAQQQHAVVAQVVAS